MSDDTVTGGDAPMHGDYTKLAQWLQSVLLPSDQDEPAILTQKNDTQLELVLTDDYHQPFYQQLPDFALAMLSGDPLATIHYTPLLYHLVACRPCHAAYLDFYDSLRYALHNQDYRQQFIQGTRTLSGTPHRMLAHLCQSLISQAEALLRQAHHDHSDNDEAARSLLQMALQVSSHITQNSLRRQALQDLVRVATLFDGPTSPRTEESNVYSYSPVMASAGVLRRGGRGGQHADDVLRAQRMQSAIIHLQARNLEGFIVQQDDMLELHLQHLDAALHEKQVVISVLLGSLLEPIRWFGGNPDAIRSTQAVDEQGTLVMPIGTTDLRLSNPEERNLLEALFLILEVRTAN
ncbi:MAG TPA: hypothetical protein VL461_00065 [Dictyobacter sp.]|nr:hypothetical protein [Dictyobacter sp.]